MKIVTGISSNWISSLNFIFPRLIYSFEIFPRIESVIEGKFCQFASGSGDFEKVREKNQKKF
jgi:uncharacterized protein (DUF2225 family)